MSAHLITSAGNTIDTKACEGNKPPHPCDPQPPCDPLKPPDDCPEPTLCIERLKNPAWPGEITRCKPGESINVKVCVKPEPPHPCDPLPGCSLKTEAEKMKKLPCNEPILCLEKIKNPDENMKKQDPSCDPNK